MHHFDRTYLDWTEEELKIEWRRTSAKPSSPAIAEFGAIGKGASGPGLSVGQDGGIALSEVRQRRGRKRHQERNAYAVNVISRIREKLEGVVSPSDRPTGASTAEGSAERKSKVLSVSQQVDYLIHQATSTDNLSVMYEGWTAWI